VSPIFANELPGWLGTLVNQAPTTAVFIGMPALLFYYMKKQHKENLKTKDAEIKRLSEEKKELQERLFGGPLLSTKPEDSAGEQNQDAKPSVSKKSAGKSKSETGTRGKGGKR